MKIITKFLFSFRLTAVILLTFAVSMAVATFIENDFGTDSARNLVYNAKWFELLLFLGMVNLIGNIVKNKMLAKGKLTMLIFHLAFVVILLGAAITRYFGFTGVTNIREGSSSDILYSDQEYINFKVSNEKDTIHAEFPVLFAQKGRNNFNKKINIGGENLKLSLSEFYPQATKTIEYVENGKPVLELVRATDNGRKSILFSEGDIKSVGNLTFYLGRDSSVNCDVWLHPTADSLVVISSVDYAIQNMMQNSFRSVLKNEPVMFYPRQLYHFNKEKIVLSNYFYTGEIRIVRVNQPEDNFPKAVMLNLQYSNSNKTIGLLNTNRISYNKLQLEDLKLEMYYGPKTIHLPFTLYLNDFILERYPGSNSPSWYESVITLKHKQTGVDEQHRIYMNNVLKYKAYRFYQSSYDSDEKGTILSVNKDKPGTFVTYLGYFLLGIGMFLSLFNKNSRFAFLSRNIEMIKMQKSSLMIIMLLACGFLFNAKAQEVRPVNPQHAAKFGELLIQDNGGRIKPVNTFSSEMLRKTSRKTTFNNLSSDQVLLSMLINPHYWQSQPMIKISHPQLKEMLGVEGKFVSFNQLVSNNQYILSAYVNEAYQKKPSQRSKFDNEVIKVDERVNVFYMSLTGELLRLFPIPDHPDDKWVDYSKVRGVNHPDTVFLKNIFPYYIHALQGAVQTNDYSLADTLLMGIDLYQLKTAEHILPPESKVKLEVWYNNFDIFNKLSRYYGLVGFILLIFQFLAIFYHKLKMQNLVRIFSYAVIILFIFHTMGLSIRWYISGHAPWSNGYESMIYISWATVLAGLFFSRKSNIALSATSILAFITLHTAHLSWMDPEITNLVPVLKSYWLVIHVAIITASYGFLAMGAIMAFINLLLMFFKSKNNYRRFDLTIDELTSVIEMTLTIGLYMLTIGTFLGGVWANESWGRYWAWDPKETWALISVIIYAFVAHMRLIPGLKGVYAFNLMSLISFASILMTYFGVNYYLSGLHSYAKGDAVPVPTFVYYTVLIIAVVAGLAYINYRKLKSIEDEN